MRVADYIMESLAEAGVRTVFMVPGGGAMFLNDALRKSDRLDFVCNLHEQASAVAAENYAKVTGELGACLVTTGPGSTNTLTGLVGAWQDSTPVVFVSGQVKRADSSVGRGVRSLGVQEVNIVEIVRSCTKYAVTLTDPERVRIEVEKSLHLARGGRPGPVWIDVPLDVQSIEIEPHELEAYVDEAASDGEDANLDLQISNVISTLNRSERPVLLVGNGTRLAGATEQLMELIELLDVPVQTTWLAIDVVADDNPRFAGRPGAVASRGANFIIQNSDFVLSIGARIDLVLTAFSPAGFAREAIKAMVDVDPNEIVKHGPLIDIPVCADAARFIERLLSRSDEVAEVDRSDWWQRCRDWMERYPIVLPQHRERTDRVSVYLFAETLAKKLERNAVIVSGSSGSAIELFLHAIKVRTGQRILHTTALGSMGFALPAVVGASVGAPGRQLIAVDGDGGFFFNVQELETISRLGLPVKIFVFNNDGFSSIRNSQRQWFGDSLIAADSTSGLTLPSITAVSEAFGIRTMTIESPIALDHEIEKVLEMAGPVVCEVFVVPDEERAPRVSSAIRPDGTIVSRPLEDMYPFLLRDELRSEMVIEVVPE